MPVVLGQSLPPLTDSNNKPTRHSKCIVSYDDEDDEPEMRRGKPSKRQQELEELESLAREDFHSQDQAI